MRNKLEALKHAIQELKNGKYYRWTTSASCNCGIVGQSVCDVDDERYHEIVHDGSLRGLWSESLNCGITGQRINLVVKNLFAVGFTKQEIIQLENLNDATILKEGGCDSYFTKNGTNIYRSDQENLIKYL